MTNRSFFIGELIGEGWKKTKQNLGFFIPLLIIAWGIPLLLNYLMNWVFKDQMIISCSIALVYMFFCILISIGMVKSALKIARDEKGSLGDLFNGGPLFFKYFFASILYSLIVMGGLILLIVPGVIWMVKFSFFQYFVVDKKMGPVAALKASSKITQGVKWDILGFWGVAWLVTLLGVLCLGVGVFLSVPTVMLASVLLYHKLFLHEEDLDYEKTETPEVLNPVIPED